MNSGFLSSTTRPLLAVPVLALGLAFAGPAAAAPLKVVATFSIIGDIVRQVGGEEVSVTSLVAPGGDAHTFEPTPADARALKEADLVVTNGLGLEGWLDRLVAASGTRARIAVLSEGVHSATMVEDEGGKSEVITDPHAWQNLANGHLYAANVATALAAVDPAHADGYHHNAVQYEAKIDALDGWVRGEIAKVPADKRRIITSHDAFGYFGRAYGVTFMAPVGISTESEPSAADVAALVRQVKEQGTRALFIENMTDPRLVRQIAEESGAALGGELYSDSLSDPDGPAPDYLTMFRHNVPAMVAGMLKN
ncbi:metal ABC transporter substrate-binding protein [Radicibacter daui]|uniref:metal ABC transporter substrate-binding protein n=1 Tax=Radicibacter daui TaxID=3064829 RepID=UPI004046B432